MRSLDLQRRILKKSIYIHTKALKMIRQCEKKSRVIIVGRGAVADLRGGVRDARPPSGPKFLHIHAVFGKNWPNNRLASPLWGWHPILRGILDQPLGSCITHVVVVVKAGFLTAAHCLAKCFPQS